MTKLLENKRRRKRERERREREEEKRERESLVGIEVGTAEDIIIAKISITCIHQYIIHVVHY